MTNSSSLAHSNSEISRVRAVAYALAAIPILAWILWVELNCALPLIAAELRFPWVIVDLGPGGLTAWNFLLLALAFVIPQWLGAGRPAFRLGAGAVGALVVFPLWQNTGVVLWTLLPAGVSAGILSTLVSFFIFVGFLAWGYTEARRPVGERWLRRRGESRIWGYSFEIAALAAVLVTPFLTLDRLTVAAAGALFLAVWVVRGRAPAFRE